MLALLHGLAFIDRTMIGGVLPVIRTAIAMSDAEAGWIIGTAFALPYAATALGIAALLRGRRASAGWLVAGVLIWTGGSIATGLARSLGELTMARAVIGVGQGIFVPIAIARLLDAAAPAVRSRALAIFTSGATMGRSVSLLTVGSLLAMLALVTKASGVADWRWLFVVTALPNILALILLATDRASVAAPDKEDAGAVALDWRTLAPFFVVAIMPVLLAQAVLGWLPTLFVRERAMSPTQAALLIGSITLVAAPAGPLIAGWTINRLAGWQDRMPAIVLVALTVTLVPLAGAIYAPGLVGAVASLTVMIVVLGIASFGGLFGVQLLIPPRARVTINGIYLAIATLVGVGAGPLLTGTLATAAGGDRGTLGNALIVTGIITAGGCALAVALSQGRYRRHFRS